MGRFWRWNVRIHCDEFNITRETCATNCSEFEKRLQRIGQAVSNSIPTLHRALKFVESHIPIGAEEMEQQLINIVTAGADFV